MLITNIHSPPLLESYSLACTLFLLQKFNPFSEYIVLVEITTQLYMKREGSRSQLDELPVSQSTAHVNMGNL